MIRFVDLRDQNINLRFAYWDTVTDSFISVDGDYAWDTWDEVSDSSAISKKLSQRLLAVTPSWAHIPDPDG